MYDHSVAATALSKEVAVNYLRVAGSNGVGLSGRESEIIKGISSGLQLPVSCKRHIVECGGKVTCVIDIPDIGCTGEFNVIEVDATGTVPVYSAA